jgi:hypothetical protein
VFARSPAREATRQRHGRTGSNLCDLWNGAGRPTEVRASPPFGFHGRSALSCAWRFRMWRKAVPPVDNGCLTSTIKPLPPWWGRKAAQPTPRSIPPPGAAIKGEGTYKTCFGLDAIMSTVGALSPDTQAGIPSALGKKAFFSQSACCACYNAAARQLVS